MAAKHIHCAQNVKTVRLCTELKKKPKNKKHIGLSNIFLICHILWHFQNGHHWPRGFNMGQKLKHAPISLKVVSNSRGGTQIWKWRISAYRRTKIGGIQCKILSNKGGHSVWSPKNGGFFLVWTPKNGGHSVCKNAISRQNWQIFC